MYNVAIFFDYCMPTNRPCVTTSTTSGVGGDSTFAISTNVNWIVFIYNQQNM
jgi:hypothetical protein